MKDFINNLYYRLNPVIINWVDYYTSLGLIDGYELTRYKVIKGYVTPNNTYKVIIDLVNDYRIDIDVSIPSNVDYHVLTVRVFSPAVERVKQDNGSVDVYPAKHLKGYLRFAEGEFDIDKDDWVREIRDLMNEYALKDKAKVEVIE